MLYPLVYLLIFLILNLPALAEESKFDLSWVKALNREAEKLAQSSKIEAKAIVDQALGAASQQKHCQIAESLAKEAEEIVRQNVELKDSERYERYPNLLVFVSFSMPLEILKALATQVNQLGGKVILRGLVKGSFKQTAEKVKELQQEVIIDPTLFEEYQIKTVPTFTLLSKRSKEDRPHKDEAYDQLAGNVSLEYALDQFTSHGMTRYKALDLLKKLRKTP